MKSTPQRLVHAQGRPSNCCPVSGKFHWFFPKTLPLLLLAGVAFAQPPFFSTADPLKNVENLFPGEEKRERQTLPPHINRFPNSSTLYNNRRFLMAARKRAARRA